MTSMSGEVPGADLTDTVVDSQEVTTAGGGSGPPMPGVMLQLIAGTYVSQAISVAARLGG